MVLDANPLENIQHTRCIHAVVINGRLLDRAHLDAMLDRAGRREGLTLLLTRWGVGPE